MRLNGIGICLSMSLQGVFGYFESGTELTIRCKCRGKVQHKNGFGLEHNTEEARQATHLSRFTSRAHKHMRLEPRGPHGHKYRGALNPNTFTLLRHF